MILNITSWGAVRLTLILKGKQANGYLIPLGKRPAANPTT